MQPLFFLRCRLLADDDDDDDDNDNDNDNDDDDDDDDDDDGSVDAVGKRSGLAGFPLPERMTNSEYFV
ncbi:hypothetical protein C8Q78DRAFT_1080821 [Trametes maxima]|nr:hypothetical protein C8Q78DRAFT_1080821 [Trametes maxima]